MPFAKLTRAASPFNFILSLNLALWHCRTKTLKPLSVCALVPQNKNSRLIWRDAMYHWLYLSNDISWCWTLVNRRDRICWSFPPEHHVISTSVPRKGTTEVQKITIFPGKIIFSWARFLRNVLTVPPSRAGKHALSLIIHSRCVYIRVPVLVRVPPIACTLMCAHAFDAASLLKWPWCSSGVMEGETNGLWRLGWSCRMQQIRNVNITDGKTVGKKAKSRWCLANEFSFSPQRTALKLQSAADSLNLKSATFCHCQDFFCNRGLLTKTEKKSWAESMSTMSSFCVFFFSRCLSVA